MWLLTKQNMFFFFLGSWHFSTLFLVILLLSLGKKGIFVLLCSTYKKKINKKQSGDLKKTIKM